MGERSGAFWKEVWGVVGVVALTLTACSFDGGLEEKVECVRIDDCPGGQICLNGTCAADISCIRNTDCPAGMLCVNAACVPSSDLDFDARDFGDDAEDAPVEDAPEDPVVDVREDTQADIPRDPSVDPEDTATDSEDATPGDVTADAGDVPTDGVPQDAAPDVAGDVSQDMPFDLADVDGDLIIVVATFDDLPSSAADGTRALVQDLDEQFRYSTALGRWIFAWFFERNPTVDNRIDGDVTPANEDIAWTQTTTGGGSITVAEGHVVMDNTAIDDALAFAHYVHGAEAGSTHWIAGEFSLTNGSGTSFLRHAVDVRNLERAAVVNLENGANGIRIVNGGDTSIGTAFGTESAATPRFIELFLFAGDRADLYVDHRLLQTVPYTSLATSGWNAYVVGNQRTTGSGVMTVRNAMFGRFTP